MEGVLMNRDLNDALRLLKAWTRSEWMDFIQDKPSPLLQATKEFIEDCEQAKGDLKNE